MNSRKIRMIKLTFPGHIRKVGSENLTITSPLKDGDAEGNSA